MEKQKKQLLVMAILLLVSVGAYFAVSVISDKKQAEADEKDAAQYAVTRLTTEEVTELTFTNADGTVSLTKSDNIWKCDTDPEAEIDGDAVEKLIANVAQLSSENRIENVEDLSLYGLEEPAKTIMISDGDTRYTVLSGDLNAITDTYYICLEEDPKTVYTTAHSTISSFDVSIEDLIVVEEESTTEAEEE